MKTAIADYFEQHKRRSRQILDGYELRRICTALDIHPEDLRMELKKLGFIRTQNKHGLPVWKRQKMYHILK